MIREAPADILTIIRSFVPDQKKPVAAARHDFSAFYHEFQGDLPEDIRQDRFAIREDLTGYWISVPESKSDRVILFFHSGGFTAGSTSDHLGFCARIARAAKAGVFSVDYRLAPEYVFPAAVQDAMDAYRYLLDNGINAHRIIPAGIAAGGNLVLALLLGLRDEGRVLPPAGICFSPIVDLFFTGESIKSNSDKDWLTPARLAAIRANYLAAHDPADPMASPTYARLRGLPRLYIQAGSHEILFDSITAFVDKARWAGVPVQYEIWEGMFHCWQLFAEQIPEGGDAIAHIGPFAGSV